MPQAAEYAREYETIYILRPDVDSEAADKVQQRVSEVIARENGQLVKLESWGRRKLAYVVAKQRTGVYFYARYIGKGGLVQELERNLKFVDSVVKYQTVQLRDDVELATLQIDAEEAKLQKVELPAYVDEPESRERSLGLVVDAAPERHRDVERDAEPTEAEATEASAEETSETA